MSRSIDYFLTSTSPWTYLGHDLFVDMARRHGLDIRYKPVALGEVFGETGGLPLPKRAPARQRYRLVELQRWRAARDLPLNLHPAHFPTDPGLADRTAIALGGAGADPADHIGRVFRAIWVEERDIADRAVIGAILSAGGHDADAILEAADGEAVRAAYAENTREAVGRDVFGAPTYVLDGEPFWGQDRLSLLAQALDGGRAAYRP